MSVLYENLFSLQHVNWMEWNMMRGPTGSLRVLVPAAPVRMERPYAHAHSVLLTTVCIPPGLLVRL